jgi:hypothetical protein
MEKKLHIRTMTLATVATKVQCNDCFTGSDEVHLTATGFGLRPPAYGGDIVWSIPLRVRASGGSYLRRRLPG